MHFEPRPSKQPQLEFSEAENTNKPLTPHCIVTYLKSPAAPLKKLPVPLQELLLSLRVCYC